MTSLRESHALRTWALVLVLVVLAAAGGERLVDTLADDEETVAWAHGARLASSAVTLVVSLVALALMGRGHHRRMATLRPAAPTPTKLLGSARDEEDEEEQAQMLVETFPLTTCLLVLALAVAVFVATYPEEPAFVRVLASTGALITFLWLLGAVASRVRAGRALRS
ncbi:MULTISPECIES: hypothetical protein [Dermacoccus]|uniref:Uncharacterized protein n=3 Tax=Dermacoccus TaxID=57495 RepID=A0A417ZBQ0_9MICO|nr:MULTISPECIES: hypothetical protein [Dermacoccus]QNK52754.1 hypothetical protein H7F30_14550 [Dermacoccus sp. PAMC28757]RHW48096.1 hypothetical protein D1832_01290 [Dermacoccus abyssi]